VRHSGGVALWGTFTRCVVTFRMDLEKRALGCLRMALWGLGFPENGPEKREWALSESSPVAHGLFAL
jgi:hypothetical protein